MRALLRFTLISSLLVWCATAQRGGGHGGGGFGGGGFHGGGGMGGGMGRGGFGGGGFRGGFGGGGFRGGFGGGGFRGGFGGGFNRGGFGFNKGFRFNNFGFRGFGFRNTGWWPWGWGWGSGWGWGWPGWGVGLSYWPSYPAYDYSDYYPYDSGGYAYAPQSYAPQSYGSSPNVVVYSQQAASAPAYSDTAHPVIRSYDQYGQEMQPSGGTSSPVYLIAMHDGAIRAAASYWVQNGTLHYVTLQQKEETVPLTQVDRQLTTQLNRERHVNVNLGQ